VQSYHSAVKIVNNSPSYVVLYVGSKENYHYSILFYSFIRGFVDLAWIQLVAKNSDTEKDQKENLK
jgi:hypothetical protein